MGISNQGGATTNLPNLTSGDVWVGVGNSATATAVDHVPLAGAMAGTIFGTVSAGTVNLALDMPFSCTINSMDINTSAGTLTAALQIGGVSVTGLSAVAVTATPQKVSATGANTVAAGNVITLVLSAISSATNLAWSVNYTKT